MRNSFLKIAKAALGKILPAKTTVDAAVEVLQPETTSELTIAERETHEPGDPMRAWELVVGTEVEKSTVADESEKPAVAQKFDPKVIVEFKLDAQIASLLTSILDGSEGACEVLNDYFEERGEPRFASEDFDYLELDDRVLLMLDNLLPAKIAKLVVCDFAEHALGNAELPSKRVKEVKQYLKKCREFYELESPSREMEEALNDQAESFFRFSEKETVANNQAVWSVWAVFMGKPSNVAIAARRTAVNENTWQIDHLVSSLPNYIENI